MTFTKHKAWAHLPEAYPNELCSTCVFSGNAPVECAMFLGANYEKTKSIQWCACYKKEIATTRQMVVENCQYYKKSE